MVKKIMKDMVRVKPGFQEGPVLHQHQEIPKPPVPEKKRIKNLPPPPPKMKKVNTESSRNGIWFLALVSLVVLFFALSLLFSVAKISLVAKVVDLNIEEKMSASKNSTSGLSFKLIVIDAEEEQRLEGDEVEEVSRRAIGEVVLYNSFSSTSQILAIDTRLQGSNGKLYKTQKRVVVPGLNSDGTPGRVNVGIYASEPGGEYNSGPLDFTIVGFKGTPKYTKFYARSVGQVEGGYVGKEYVISDEKKQEVVDGLKESLKVALINKAQEQIPPGFVLFDGAYVSSNEIFSDSETLEDGTLSFRMKSTMYGFIFDQMELEKKLIAENTDQVETANNVYVKDLDKLVFTLVDKEGAFSEIEKIDFTLKGPAQIVYSVDTEEISLDVLGKNRKEFEEVLSRYPNISSAELSIRPSWRKKIPERLKSLQMEVKYPE